MSIQKKSTLLLMKQRQCNDRNPAISYLLGGFLVSGRITAELLKGFLEAFNRHDLDSIMDYFADDCVFYMPRGAKPRGDRYVGKKEVRAGLAKRFEGIPDVHYGDDQHWVCGRLGVSEWTLTGTTTSGQEIEVRGVDLLEFADGKIIRKDSFWKILE
jgi:ketosteroid isomerase-like protein